jgi:membrane-bound lytic murein transglycosylase F
VSGPVLAVIAGLSLISLSAPAAEAPKASRALRVLVVPDAGRPDFFAADASARPGFEREILEGFARSRQMGFEIVPVATWDEVIAALVEGKGDVIAGHCTDTAERRRHVDFTDGVLPTRTVVVTRRPQPSLLLRKELLERRIGAVKGTAAHEALLGAGVPKSHIDDTLTPENMLERLRDGKVEGVVRGAPLAILSQRDDPALELGMMIGPPSHFAWGVRKGGGDLRRQLNEHLALVRRTGGWNRLVVKYFGSASVEILKRAQE